MTMTMPAHSRRDELPSVRQLRHRAEVPMLLIGTVLTAIALLALLILVIDGTSAPGWLRAIAATIILVPFVMALYLLPWTYWRVISNGIEVTERQFPEVHAIFCELADRLGMTADAVGMKHRPRLYVVNGNGVMNAYATKCTVRQGYIVIYSDLLDLAYEYGRFDTLRFILGHELGHIHCGHVNIRRQLIGAALSLTQLRQSMSRAQEYTADRVGGFLAPEGATGLIGLYAGKHIQKQVQLDAYLDSIPEHKDGFWLKFANFRADHPVGFRRMAALARIRDEGWDVHGKFF